MEQAGGSEAACAERQANAAQCVSLPMFPELTAEEVDYTIAKVREWDTQFGK